MADFESLEIQISTEAKKAFTNLDKLTSKINNVATSLYQIDTSKLKNIGTISGHNATGVSKLSSSMSSLSGSTKKAGISLGNISQLAGKFYSNCFLMIRGAKKVGQAIGNSMDYIETYNYYSVIMDKIGKEFGKDYKKWGYNNADEYAKSFEGRIDELTKKMTGYDIGKNGELTTTGEIGLGLDPEQLMNYQAKISSVTNSVGLMGETSINTAKAMSMLSSDLSSLTNMDIKSVMTNLQSGLIGQSRSMYKFGVDITNTMLQVYAELNGVTKKVAEMTQSEKMQLRVLAILDQTKVAWGDQANTINSVANQQRLLSQSTSNMSRVFGNLFIPVLQKVLPMINGLTIAITRLFSALGVKMYGDNWLTDIMDGISGGYAGDDLGDIEDGIDGIGDSSDKASKKTKKLKDNLIGIDKLNIISPDTGKSDKDKDKGKGKPIDLSKQIATAVADYEKIWNKALKRSTNLAEKYADAITKAFKSGDWEGVGKFFNQKLTGALKSINWEKVYSGASNFGKGLANFLNRLITPDLFGQVGKTIAGALNTKIYAALNFAKTFNWKNIGVSFAEGINGFFKEYDFAALAQTLNTWVDGIETALGNAIININWKNVLKGMYKFFSNLDFDTLLFIPAVKSLGKLKVFMSATAKSSVTAFGQGLKTIGKEFLSLGKNIKVLGGKDGIKYTFLEAGSSAKKFSSSLTKMQKGLIGLGAVFGEFAAVKTSIKQLADGSGNAALQIGKITAAAGLAAGALKLIGLSNPFTAAITGATLLVGAFVGLSEHEKEERDRLDELQTKYYGITDEMQKVIDKTKERADTWNELQSSTQSNVDSISAEYGELQNLRTELQNITDENGKVKKGYEDRAKVILTTLNEALGTEYTLTGNQVNQYKDLQKEIDNTIKKKEGEALLSAYQEQFNEAVKGQTEAYTELDESVTKNKEAKDKYNAALSEEKSLQEQIKELKNGSNSEDFGGMTESLTKIGELESKLKDAKSATKKAKDTFDETSGAVKTATETYSKYESVIKNYKGLQAAVITGDAKKIEDASLTMKNGFVDATNGTMEQLEQQKKDSEKHLSELQTLYDEKVPGITDVMIDEAKKMVDKSDKELKKAKKAGTTGIDSLVEGLEKEADKKAIQKRAVNALTPLSKSMDNVFNRTVRMTLKADVDQSEIDDFLKKMNKGSMLNVAQLSYDPAPKFAMGGFPEDGLFFANHNELVGKFANGKTAVANNDQITTGIERAVTNAMMNILPTIFANSNQKSEKGDTIINLDGHEIARVVNRENARSGAKLVGYENGYV